MSWDTTILKPKKERGYGPAFQRERRRWARIVQAGGVYCARRGLPISPTDRWHLDHDDEDRSLGALLGPSHASCNLRAAAIRGQAVSAVVRRRKRRRRPRRILYIDDPWGVGW